MSLDEFYFNERRLPKIEYAKKLMLFDDESIRSLILHFLQEDNRVMQLLVRDESSLDFLSAVLKKCSDDILHRYCKIITEIFEETIETTKRNKEWLPQQTIFINRIVELCFFVGRGVNKFTLMDFLRDAQNAIFGFVPDEVLTEAAYLLSSYPIQDSQIWFDIDLNKFSFLLGPSINATANHPDLCLQILLNLRPGTDFGDIQIPLSKFLAKCFDPTLSSETKKGYYRRFFNLDISIQKELDKVLHLTFQATDEIFRLIKPIRKWKLEVRERLYSLDRPERFCTLDSLFYDTEIINSIKRLGISDKYNVTIENIPTKDYVRAAPLLLDEKTIDKAVKETFFDGSYQFTTGRLKEANVLITYPIEALTDNLSKGIDIAVLDLFNYAIVSNITPSQELINNLNSIYNKVPNLMKFFATLLQYGKNTGNGQTVYIYVNDSGIRKVMEPSLDKLRVYFEYFFKQKVIFEFEFEKLANQRELVKKLKKPNSLVITTGPVLADILEQEDDSNLKYFIYTNSNFVDELIESGEDDNIALELVELLNKSVLHQALYINVSYESYKRDRDIKYTVHKLAKLTYYASNHIAENLDEYIDFIVGNYDPFKVSDNNPKRVSIKRAIEYSYQFPTLTEQASFHTQYQNIKCFNHLIYYQVMTRWSQTLKFWESRLTLLENSDSVTSKLSEEEIVYKKGLIDEIKKHGAVDYLLCNIEPSDLKKLIFGEKQANYVDDQLATISNG